MAISPSAGVVTWKIFEGALDSDCFAEFFQDVQQGFAKNFSSTICILDNCRVHKRDDLTKLLQPNHEIKFLPPYSPFFNPIENCFNVIKQKVRSSLVSEAIIHRSRQADTAPWGSKMEARRTILVDVLSQAISEINSALVMSFKLETLQYIPKVLNKETL